MSARLMMKSLPDWRQRLDHRHPDFKPGYVQSEGVNMYYVDEEGREFMTVEGMMKIQNIENPADPQDIPFTLEKDEKKTKTLHRHRSRKNSTSHTKS